MTKKEKTIKNFRIRRKTTGSERVSPSATNKNFNFDLTDNKD